MRARIQIQMLVVAFVLAISLIAVFESAAETEIYIGKSGLSILMDHGVIRINNNTDFARMAQLEGWPGNGSSNNPYIISNYTIDAHGAGVAIFIGNTTVHFIIENCTLHNTSSVSWLYGVGAGVHLYNVENGTVRDSNIYDNARYGVYIEGNSRNNTISNNSIGNNGWNGIYCDMDSSHNLIVNNSIFGNNWNGIYLELSSGNIIRDNAVFNNTNYGIYLDLNSENNTVINNTLHNSGNGDIYVYDSGYNTFYGNNITHGGIVLDGSEKTFATQTIAPNNTVNGQPVIYYANLDLRNATLPAEVGEVILGNDTNMWIYGIGVNNSSAAVLVGYSSNIMVENSVFNDNYNGIYITYSSNVTVKNNTISNSVDDDIYVTFSKNVVIENNVLLNSGNSGVHIDSSETSIISDNRILNPAIGGIVLSLTPHDVIKNNTIEKSGYFGIYMVFNVDNSTIIDNTVKDSRFFGIAIEYSSNDEFYNNTQINSSFVIWGDENSYTTQTIPTNNTVNGKPVYYYSNEDMNNATAPTNAGQIILGNVKNFKIEGFKVNNTSSPLIAGFSSDISVGNGSFSNNTYGIFLAHSENMSIDECNISQSRQFGIVLWATNDSWITNNEVIKTNYTGVYLVESGFNYVVGNLVSGASQGIYLDGGSMGNVIAGNDVYNNIAVGLHIVGDSNYTDVSDNIFDSNGVAIHIESSSYNNIYRNSFYFNAGSGDTFNFTHVQAIDDGLHNYWNGTDGVGNYWQDWANNNDTNDQNNDGLVDWPYLIGGSAGVRDYYPMKTTYLGDILSHPLNLEAMAGGNYVNLSWEEPWYGSDTVTGYKIYRNGVFIAEVPATQLYFNDTNVVYGQTYTYYVTAINETAESAPSNEVQATPSGEVPEFTGPWGVILIALLFVVLLRLKR